MVESIGVNGRMENNMVLDFILGKIKSKEKDIGKMEKELNGLMRIKNND